MRRQNPDRSVEESQTNAAARRAKGEFMRGVSQFRSALVSPDDFTERILARLS